MHARRFTFTAKLAGLGMLVALADVLAFDGWGPLPGAFALGWASLMLAVVAPIRRSTPARVAILAALGFALVLLDDPSLLTWTMFWTALSLAGLLSRHGFDDAWRWGQRLLLHVTLGIATPFRDARRLLSVRRARGQADFRAVAKVLALPLIGSIVFLALFAVANPLIGDAFARLELPSIFTMLLHAALWTIVIFAIWPNMRPRPGVTLSTLIGPAPSIADQPVFTLTLSLIAFNTVFALQNGLDLAFLWSGATLPNNVSQVEYVHRGAYTLIATALLAGLFVLAVLRPDSPGGRSPMIRWLVVLWVAQNMLLVASSVLRLFEYIATSMLTVLRISALAWMGLVAVGLALICWRLLANRSSAWLINVNALAATMVLSLASLVDLGAAAADWNVRHARTGVYLDLCYLGELGPSALLPLIALERRVSGDRLRDRVAYVRAQAFEELVHDQSIPRTATLRGGRRLAEARDLLGPNPLRARPAPFGRNCDGSIIPSTRVSPQLTGGR